MNRKLFAGTVALALVLSLAGAVSAATRTAAIYVKGMTCGGCATMIEEALKQTEGVLETRASYERGKAWVKYDDQKVNIAKLREVINGTGFQVVTKPAKRIKQSGKQKATSCCSPTSCDT